MLYSAARFVIMRPASANNGATKNLVGFPSGQREQTVNLPSQTSKVRILPPPPSSLPESIKSCQPRLSGENRITIRNHEFRGGVPERPKGADCKSAVSDFEGSNPSPTTILSCSSKIPNKHKSCIFPMGKAENLR